MAALVDLVNFQLENAKALSTVLRQETQAITARVSSEIESIAKQKMTLIDQLRTTDQRIASHP
ncbi:flagellar export chaperone FlgN, partial [Escherichia coli]|nr:flagellar export chaperone FlgN [Escherichia coli]